jgi:hypothetical protein
MMTIYCHQYTGGIGQSQLLIVHYDELKYQYMRRIFPFSVKAGITPAVWDIPKFP